MRLHRTSRDYYVVEATATPTLSGPREASFDYGETWIEGHPDGESWNWLVAGADFDPGDQDPGAADVTISDTVVPRIRMIEDPVDFAVPGPIIRYFT